MSLSKITNVIKGSEHDITLFSQDKLENLEKRIVDRVSKKGETKYYVTCLVRGKEIMLTPEEVVRQLYLDVLMNDFNYPKDRFDAEYVVTFGTDKSKRADIVIYDKQKKDSPYIIVEVKKPKLKEGKDQLKSYCNATGAPIGIWTNGKSISYYHRKDPNYFEDITTIPKATQKLADVIEERWTMEQLRKKDKLVNERKSLKDLILEMEDEVLAGAGVDVFEEVFKLIFTKLYDEYESGRKDDRYLEFRNYGYTEKELKDIIQELFDKAKNIWAGIFPEEAKILLTPSHLSICVAALQDVKLFNSNLDVIDEAFEYLINKTSKEEKGQYFTPRYVIDMCVKMLNPKEDEKMIDPAAGSCGFPVHTIFYVWKEILRQKGLKTSHLFSLEKKPAECEDYVRNNVFAIDFDEKAVRVARTLNVIAGDGQSNVLHLNTLDYEKWDDIAKDEWMDSYQDGWKKLKKLRVNKNSNRDFKFDIVMANPPFAGDIKEGQILSKYDISKSISLKKLKELPAKAVANKAPVNFVDVISGVKSKIYEAADGTFREASVTQSSSVSRDLLFVERNLQFLKPGGRMAIVLPQGRFNNTSDLYLRQFIADRCRILAVVGLHSNVFKPHTGTKTSVLFVQKWDDKLCPKVEDYNIFFATMQEPSKDSSGDKIYRNTTDDNGENVPLLDGNGHLVVKHDLFNHDGLTQDGIAEAFIEFAKKEGLSFFP